MGPMVESAGLLSVNLDVSGQRLQDRLLPFLPPPRCALGLRLRTVSI